jgi:hypothetical protein
MTNTWFTDLVRAANERPLGESDLTRIAAYYATAPARLRLSEELERLEPGLVKPLHAELVRRYPDRPLYARRLVQDLVEGLRHLNRAVLADDLRLVRRKWVDHLIDAAAATDTDPAHICDAYAVLGELLERQLPRSAWEVLRPAFADMLDALTRGPAVPA